MHIGHVMGAAVGPLMVIVGLVVIGGIFTRRAGPGSGRMWAGLGMLIVLEVLAVGWTYVFPSIAYRGTSLAALSLGYGVINGVIFLVAIALLASAVAMGRTQHAGYLDPTRPGAPPTTYEGTGYPPVSGRSPYEAGYPDGDR